MVYNWRYCNMKCNHEWVELNRYYYLDYNGYRVLKVTYRCKKCNKKKIKKYF